MIKQARKTNDSYAWTKSHRVFFFPRPGSRGWNWNPSLNWTTAYQIRIESAERSTNGRNDWQVMGSNLPLSTRKNKTKLYWKTKRVYFEYIFKFLLWLILNNSIDILIGAVRWIRAGDLLVVPSRSWALHRLKPNLIDGGFEQLLPRLILFYLSQNHKTKRKSMGLHVYSLGLVQ